MESYQRSAIEHHKLELIESMNPTAVCFLSYLEVNGIINFNERQFTEKNFILTKDQLLHLFGSLQHNDQGWSAIDKYLRDYNQTKLADKLEKTAGQLYNPEEIAPIIRSKLDEFCILLTQYYQLHYANLLTLWELPDHIEHRWVPLPIDCKSDDCEKTNQIDHVELLSQLKSPRGCRNVALIKGDPGAGKTTLVKKFAYDWAVNYANAAENQFSLVLAVPLRSVGKFDDFVQLSIDYFLSKVNLCAILNYTEDDKEQLIRMIRGLGENLLIIVDGLDEYGSYADSPFKNLYSQPFDTDAANSTCPPPILPFKLIITSRPYACNRINMEFFPLRYDILPLSHHNFKDFVQRYCRTEDGRMKALKYAYQRTNVVTDVPLILTFVCYLADQKSEQMPTTLTSLYDSFLYQMLRKAKRDEKLTEKIDDRNWKASQVVQSTAQLAFQHFAVNQYEFDQEDMQKFGISNDSFTCGFLLHKYEVTQECLKAEFPHRSIKDFFSALHCYQLFVDRNEAAKNDLMTRVIGGDNSIGRFFFGICSKQGKFEEAVEWLQISIDRLHPYSFCNLKDLLNPINFSLADCTEREQTLLGEKLFNDVDRIEQQVTTRWNQDWSPGLITPLSESFAAGLHLEILGKMSRNELFDWCITDDKDPRLAKLLWVTAISTSKWSNRFGNVGVFIWNRWRNRWAFPEIKSLNNLPIRTLLVPLGTEINIAIRIQYVGVPVQSLTNFRFAYDKRNRDSYLSVINSLDLKEITGEAVEMLVNRTAYYRCTVNVSEVMSQSDLIGSLVKLSLIVSNPVQLSNDFKLKHLKL